MFRFLLLLILLLSTTPLRAQEPTINWGPEIPHSFRNLNKMQVIGIGKNGSFYTRYTENHQITLELYNQENQKVWAVAIAPQSPDGTLAKFEALTMFNHQVYLISSVGDKYKKSVFGQPIDADGNYLPTIRLLATTTPDAEVYTRSEGGRLLLVLQQQAEPQQTSVALYFGSLTPLWTQSIPVKGEISEMHIAANGTSFILTKLPATNSPESAFYLYRFEGRNGKSSDKAIGSTANRPLQAKMSNYNGDIVVAGVTSPAPFVASLQPEPTGTFFYRFPKGRFRKYTLNYAPIDSLFLHNYKFYKPDSDHSQRLRNLQLQHLMPLTNNRIVLLGEVYTLKGDQKTGTHHTDDILAVAFASNGRPVYTTSANKHQSGQANQVRLGSYLATTAQDTVKLIYLDFEYNYNEKDQIIMASPRAVLKTPVLVSILPDGAQKVKPLRNTRTGRHQKLYLCPLSAFPVSKKEFIVLGSGNGYYKYGRLKF
ncbi:hypothetical protein H8S95_13620 [Pontibacter sp. KCTC 32443]|uniref:hypothetical protein n=1 Tax=Pontibacter TaxID=323449 RepID=UPI00164E24A8|nr:MULTISPECIES: hypothetical protein [Pontibacter]MBC5775111.1 hypothetical protein [Pontibacter sp. KCTC 32443]